MVHNKKKKLKNKSLDHSKIKGHNIILLVILIIAIMVRIYNDINIPFHYDPGKNIVYSRAILEAFPLFPQYNQYFNLGEYYEYQVLFPYIVALLYKITGFSLVDITSWSIIIIGSLMTITIYLLSMEIFDNIQVALISAGLIALSKIQLFAYMNYYPQILGMTLLPIPFIFLIRYVKTYNTKTTKTYNKKYLIYISILSGAIILSSYIAGMIYISILTLSLIIYSIIKKDLRYIYTLFSIIIGTLLLVTFYILPILDRHGIKLFIVGISNTIFTQKDIPFTNINLQDDVAILKLFSFIIVITLILIISYLLYLFDRKLERVNFYKIKFEHILLFLLISVPLILVESYKFRPILWVDRYIEFLDIALIILVGYSIYFILDKIRYKIRYNNHLKNNYNIISALILILVFSYPTYEVVKHQYRFGYWNTPSDLEALNWVDNKIPFESLFVTPSGITSFWVSALGGIRVLGGESSQMLGDRFDGNNYSNIIINSPNIDEKMDLIRKFGVQYIYLTFRSRVHLLWNHDYDIEGLKALDNPKYFEFVYKKQERFSITYIIKIKEDLTPKYNIPKINKNITMLGYVISLMTLIIMMISLRKGV